MVEVEDRLLPHRGQLGVDRPDIGLAEGVAGQVDLPHRVEATGATDDLPPSRNTVPPGTRLVA